MLAFRRVTYTYDKQSFPTLEDLSVDLPAGWSGVVGPNGVGKSTFLSLAVGTLRPDSGTVERPDTVLYCAQRTDHPPGDLTELLSFPDGHAGRLVSRLGIEADWPYRWETLSHGERKRAQVAVALWHEPDLLALDEPTNHLDRPTVGLLAMELATYRGVGLLVSHDRDLLDRLCARCLFLDPHREPTVRPGGVTAGIAEQERDELEQSRRYQNASAEMRRIESERARRRAVASAQNAKRSKRGLAPKDSDAREKIDRARVSGADGQAGRVLSQLDGRAEQAHARLSGLQRPVRRRTGVTVRGSRAGGDAILRRAAGRLPLPDGRLVLHPDLAIGRSDAVAILGANGAGKTTLLTALLESSSADSDHIVSIPQEISIAEASALRTRIAQLSDAALGRVISTVSRLGSDPVAVLETAEPSPGEARKLLLALGLERTPQIVVMDEPTNHMDLVSIYCLEAALAEFEGALLLISHDLRFVRALATVSWAIEGETLYVKDIEPE